MQLASRIALSVVVCLALVSCGESTDDPTHDPPDSGGQDASEDGGDPLDAEADVDDADTDAETDANDGDGDKDGGMTHTGDGGSDTQPDATTPHPPCVDGATGGITEGWCLIDGLCVEEGEAHPDTACQVCDPDQDRESWAMAPNGTLCTAATEEGETEGTCLSGRCKPDDNRAPCMCEEESDCCDGCNVINVGGNCGGDTLLCVTNICTETGECGQIVREGWCLVEETNGTAPFRCANTATDPEHCGTCGHACQEGEACTEGSCFIPVTGVTMDQTTLIISPEETGSLTATVEPEEATFKTVYWESMNEDVATVDENGVVTPVSTGEVVIKVSTNHDHHVDQITVIVRVPLTGATIHPDSVNMNAGAQEPLTVQFDPEDASYMDLLWESLDGTIATVDHSGLVTGIKGGETVIRLTITTWDGEHTVDCPVTVDMHHWAQSIIGTGYVYPTDLAVDLESNIFMTGLFSADITFNEAPDHQYSTGAQYDADGFIAKYDSDGQLLWTSHFGGSDYEDVVAIGVNGEGDVTVAGFTFSPVVDVGGARQLHGLGEADIILFQYNRFGELNWAKLFGTTGYEYVLHMILDGEGNIYFTGRYFTSGLNFGGPDIPYYSSNDSFLVKLNSQGEYQWSTVFHSPTGGNDAQRLALDKMGNVIVGGSFQYSLEVEGEPLYNSIDPEDDDGAIPFIAKYDQDGNKLWAKAFGADNGEIITLVTDPNNNILVSGLFTEQVHMGGDLIHGENTFFVAKLDSNGEHIWSKGMEAGQWALNYGLEVDGEGTVYLSGYYEGHLNLGGNILPDYGWGETTYLAKLTGGGDHLWSVSYEPTDSSYYSGCSITLDDDGRLLFAGMFKGDAIFGSTSFHADETGAFLVKMSP